MTLTLPANSRHRRFLAPQEAADYLGINFRTLERWRLEGSGPAFCKLPRLVRYDVSELDRWMQSRRRSSTSDLGPEYAHHAPVKGA